MASGNIQRPFPDTVSLQVFDCPTETSETFTVPSGYRGVMYITDSSAANMGAYIVASTGAGSLVWKEISSATNITVSSPENNKLKFEHGNNGLRYLVFNVNSNNIIL